MLCTYIRDQYKEDEAAKIAAALSDITSPIDNYGWASAGIYCFWDPVSNEVLYIGLAVELSQRFMQHNGLISYNPNGCKVEQIKRWFVNNEKLGYSVLVQSTMSQPLCRSLEKAHPSNNLRKNYGQSLEHGQFAIERSEGLLIAAYKKQNGKIPAWNKVGGSIMGAEIATQEHVHMVNLFTHGATDESVARSSIREISENPSFEVYEQFLHGIRLKMILNNFSFNEAWENTPGYLEEKERMVSAGYLRLNSDGNLLC